MIAVGVYAAVGMLFSFVTVNGQPNLGDDVVMHLGERGFESQRAEMLHLDGV